jgi:hypothetical protein
MQSVLRLLPAEPTFEKRILLTALGLSGINFAPAELARPVGFSKANEVTLRDVHRTYTFLGEEGG